MEREVENIIEELRNAVDRRKGHERCLKVLKLVMEDLTNWMG